MRIAAYTTILLLAGSSAMAEPAPLRTLDSAQSTSWSLTCKREAQETTGSTGRAAVLKVTAAATASGAIIHWKAPAGDWMTLALRPVGDNTWASRIELGTEDGTHQLQCMILGAETGDGDSHILARAYQLALPSFKMDETGGDEVWSHGRSPKTELLKPTPLAAMAIRNPTAPAKAKAGFSPILAAMIVFGLNLVFAFAAGLALTWHRRRKAHRETPFMHEVHGRLAEAGMIAAETCAPVPLETAPEVEKQEEAEAKQDVVEDLAVGAVMESMDQAISEAKEEKPVEAPDEGVEIRTAQADDLDPKLDMNDLSF
ncbi:MAG: hypothetical protein ABFD69_14205 [Candidatus Sumerlaeia bacterium]